jgi:hypothetical protein
MRKCPLAPPKPSKTFLETAPLYQRGGLMASTCGARTRNGGACPNPPIREGRGRCLSHCGPKAAKEYRERQKRRFEAGQISAAEWNRAEARRAANRLGDRWKKNPWLPGSTIDLEGHEVAFRIELSGTDTLTLPPAVLDWLRWRYQRLQVDTRNHTRWAAVLTKDLPRRLNMAGKPPEGRASAPVPDQINQRIWKPDGDAKTVQSRRRLPDLQRAPKAARSPSTLPPGRPRTRPIDNEEHAELCLLMRKHANILRPVLAARTGAAQEMAILRTLQAYLASPLDAAARQRWISLVTGSHTVRD